MRFRREQPDPIRKTNAGDQAEDHRPPMEPGMPP